MKIKILKKKNEGKTNKQVYHNLFMFNRKNCAEAIHSHF